MTLARELQRTDPYDPKVVVGGFVVPPTSASFRVFHSSCTRTSGLLSSHANTQFQSFHPVLVLLLSPLLPKLQVLVAVGVVELQAVPQAVTVCVMYTVVVACSHCPAATVGTEAGAAELCQSPQAALWLFAGAGDAAGVVAGVAAGVDQSPQVALSAGTEDASGVDAGDGTELAQSPQPEL